MTLREKIRGIESDDSLSKTKELELYQVAGAELENDERNAGVWAKAMAKGKGNPEGKYIEYRFQALKADYIHKREDQRKRYKKEQQEKALVEKTERDKRYKEGARMREKEAAENAGFFTHLTGGLMFASILIIILVAIISIII